MVCPFLAILVCLIARGKACTNAPLSVRGRERRPAGVHPPGGALRRWADPAAQIAEDLELLASGAITQAESDAIKIEGPRLIRDAPTAGIVIQIRQRLRLRSTTGPRHKSRGRHE